MGGIRRWVAACAAGTVLSAGLLAVTAQQAAAETTYVAPAGNLTVYGKGYGHGRGMSQYGAQGHALAGRTYTQILDFYYPGTTTATIPSANRTIRVHITADTSPGLKVRAVSGLRVQDLGTNAEFTLPVATAYTHWELRPYGDTRTQLYRYSTSAGWQLYRSMAGMAQFEGPPVTRLVLPSGSEVPYRGTLRTADRAGTDLDTINILSMDYYLRGVVPKESPSSWRPAALQAQAVAARTYAYSKRTTSRDYDLCDTTACQVYGGYGAEVTSTSNAVVATGNVIRTYGGTPILAEFSSSNGGYTAPGDKPYLTAKADPYDAYPGNGNANANWSVSLNRATTEAKFGVGTLKAIIIGQRNGYSTWGGRVVSAEIRGTTATRTYTGDQLRFLLGLKSTWIRFDTSAITKRWLAIGGGSSAVGNPIGYEWPVRGGTGQAFATGHIYWSSGFGAWEIYGGFETRYQQIGGPNHAIGLPIAARFNGAKAGSLVQRFGAGRMFYSAATSTREVYGPIYNAYYSVGLEGGRLGLPTSYRVPFTSGGGWRQHFQGGYINLYASNNSTYIVYT
jgi:SpoIID/LytB domain protein